MARTAQPPSTVSRQAPPPSIFDDSLRDGLSDPLGDLALQFQRTGPKGAPGGERAAAARGLQGSGRELPFRSRIERSFGVDLGGVRAHMGAGASDAAGQLGAQGFTMGNSVAFASSSPSVGLVAHEAAHVVQQADGVHLSGGVGQSGDAYEASADAAAARVVAGQSAADLLPTGGAPGSEAGGGGEGVQFKRESKDESSWTTTDNGLVLLTGSQNLYADQGLIDAANNKLQSVGKNGSYIKLASDGEKYDHEGHSLTRVVPQWVDHKDLGDHKGSSEANDPGVKDSNGITSEGSVDSDGVAKMALWADCGRSSGAITGSIAQNNSDRQAVYKKGGKEKLTRGRADAGMNRAANTSVGRMANSIYFELMPGFISKKSNRKYLTEGVHYKKGFLGIVSPLPVADGLAAQEMYGKMTPEGQLAFDQEAGINAFANPEIGEAYAMATGYDIPGFKNYKGKNAWNFHWGGVIMKDGADNITLENYAVIAEGIDRFINRDWNFAIYGTMKASGGAKDTFHSEHLASKTHGTKATSMAVRTDK